MSGPRLADLPSSPGERSEQAESEADPYKAFYASYFVKQKARLDHGTAYPVYEEELRILQSETFSSSSAGWRQYPPPISMSVADDRLQRPSDHVGPDVQAALDRIKEYTAGDRPIMWDMVIKIFDKAYFQGILRRRVLLQWKAFKKDPAIFAADPSLKNLGLTLPPCTPPNQHSRVRIYLRTDFRWLKVPRLYILGCLLHEMLHAYFIVSCGGDGAREVGAEDPGHGPLFVRAAKWLEERSGLDLLSDWLEVARRREEGSRRGEMHELI